MNEAVFGHEIDNTMLLGDLHGDGKVVSSLRRKINIDGFLDERRVRCGMINFYDMQLDNKY